MNVVDSSAWIEYFTDGPNASFFQPTIRDSQHLIVPSICLYEVFRHGLAHRTRELAIEFYKAMSLGTIVELTPEIALAAAELAHEHKLAMADSIILATAREYDATLWTQDVDFEGLDKVKFRAKQK